MCSNDDCSSPSFLSFFRHHYRSTHVCCVAIVLHLQPQSKNACFFNISTRTIFSIFTNFFNNFFHFETGTYVARWRMLAHNGVDFAISQQKSITIDSLRQLQYGADMKCTCVSNGGSIYRWSKEIIRYESYFLVKSSFINIFYWFLLLAIGLMCYIVPIWGYSYGG